MKTTILTYVITLTITTQLFCTEQAAFVGICTKVLRRPSQVVHTGVNHDLLSLSNFEELKGVQVGDTITTLNITSSHLESSLQFFVNGNNLSKLANTHNRPENIYLVTTPGALLITSLYHRYTLNEKGKPTIKQHLQKYTLEVTQ